MSVESLICSQDDRKRRNFPGEFFSNQKFALEQVYFMGSKIQFLLGFHETNRSSPWTFQRQLNPPRREAKGEALIGWDFWVEGRRDGVRRKASARGRDLIVGGQDPSPQSSGPAGRDRSRARLY